MKQGRLVAQGFNKVICAVIVAKLLLRRIHTFSLLAAVRYNSLLHSSKHQRRIRSLISQDYLSARKRKELQ